MNRRSFLAGLGAAVAAVAVATRLGETRLMVMPPPREAMSRYLTDPDSWYIAVDQGGPDRTAISTFYRHADGTIELLDTRFEEPIKEHDHDESRIYRQAAARREWRWKGIERR